MERSAAISRRSFLTGSTHPEPAPAHPLPPGVTPASVEACTGCGDCITACPENILDIRQGRVAVDFDRGECTFCDACADICEEPVFADAPREMAHAVVIGDGCLAKAGIACMTCRDACPEQAIAMRPRMGGPFLPELSPADCTGCGACIAPCPVSAIGLRLPEVTHDPA